MVHISSGASGNVSLADIGLPTNEVNAPGKSSPDKVPQAVTPSSPGVDTVAALPSTASPYQTESASSTGKNILDDGILIYDETDAARYIVEYFRALEADKSERAENFVQFLRNSAVKDTAIMRSLVQSAHALYAIGGNESPALKQISNSSEIINRMTHADGVAGGLTQRQYFKILAQIIEALKNASGDASVKALLSTTMQSILPVMYQSGSYLYNAGKDKDLIYDAVGTGVTGLVSFGRSASWEHRLSRADGSNSGEKLGSAITSGVVGVGSVAAGVTAGAVAGGVAAGAAGFALANFWNPAGWIVGGLALTGAAAANYFNAKRKINTGALPFTGKFDITDRADRMLTFLNNRSAGVDDKPSTTDTSQYDHASSKPKNTDSSKKDEVPSISTINDSVAL